jgi:hypothetical protein
MSYREENGQVILTMSREDYEVVHRMLRSLVGCSIILAPHNHFKVTADFYNRLNFGNPDFTPYTLADAHTDGGKGPRIARPKKGNRRV